MSALAELYTIPQEHLDFRETIRQMAAERIAPRAAEIDERAEYPHDLRKLQRLVSSCTGRARESIAEPRTSASTRRWRSCSARTWR